MWLASWKAVEHVTIVNIRGPCSLSAIYFKRFPGGIAFIYESLATKLKANGFMRPSYKTRWNPSLRGQQLCKFIGAKKGATFNVRKRFKNHRDTNIAAVSLFWNTNMADVKSCENALFLLVGVRVREERNFQNFQGLVMLPMI